MMCFGRIEQRVHEPAMLRGEVRPEGEPVLAAVLHLVRLVEDAALVAPKVRQRINDDDVEARLLRRVDRFDEDVRLERRFEGDHRVIVEIRVEVARPALGVDEADRAADSLRHFERAHRLART